MHNVTNAGKKRAFLLSFLDLDTFSLLQNSFGPNHVAEQSVNDLINKPSGCQPFQAAKYSFYECSMLPGESFSMWIASLRGILTGCIFICKSGASHHCSYVDELTRDEITRNTPTLRYVGILYKRNHQIFG